MENSSSVLTVDVATVKDEVWKRTGRMPEIRANVPFALNALDSIVFTFNAMKDALPEEPRLSFCIDKETCHIYILWTVDGSAPRWDKCIDINIAYKCINKRDTQPAGLF